MRGHFKLQEEAGQECQGGNDGGRHVDRAVTVFIETTDRLSVFKAVRRKIPLRL